MEAYYVYILYSQSLDRYYTGSTGNVEERIIRHNSGATKSTKSGRPWTIAYVEEYPTRSEAIKREQYIKRQKSRIFIENLITKAKS